MERNEACLTNTCSFAGIKPIMVDLPYPPIQVRRENPAYANLLGMDYCGPVSELSAITQYINNENRISHEKCAMAKTLLGIGIAEMMHLQKLGQLICLLGGKVDFIARPYNGRPRMWKMLQADIAAEKDAISQYQMHIKMIDDDCVNTVLRRIIQDEEYHVMLLQALVRAG